MSQQESDGRGGAHGGLRRWPSKGTPAMQAGKRKSTHSKQTAAATVPNQSLPNTHSKHWGAAAGWNSLRILGIAYKARRIMPRHVRGAPVQHHGCPAPRPLPNLRIGALQPRRSCCCRRARPFQALRQLIFTGQR